LNRHPYAADTLADRADDTLSARDIDIRQSGVEVKDISLSFALWAWLVSTGPGEGGLMVHAPSLPVHVGSSSRRYRDDWWLRSVSRAGVGLNLVLACCSLFVRALAYNNAPAAVPPFASPVGLACLPAGVELLPRHDGPSDAHADERSRRRDLCGDPSPAPVPAMRASAGASLSVRWAPRAQYGRAGGLGYRVGAAAAEAAI
jgi:hypothetical protein